MDQTEIDVDAIRDTGTEAQLALLFLQQHETHISRSDRQLLVSSEMGGPDQEGRTDEKMLRLWQQEED